MRTTTRSNLDAALLILAVGFAFSLAANLLWTWQGGVVRILGGALASLALPGAIHLWPRIPVHSTLMRRIRGVVMTGIACMAAFTTFSHARELLIQHGEEPLLATLYPVMTELLVVMGVLARHTSQAVPAAARPRVERAPRKPPVATPETVEPAERTEESPIGYARKNWPVSGAEIKLSTGCSKGYAYKVAAQVREEMSA